MSRRISFFKVSNRKIEKINDVNYAGTNEVDKFHFFFEDAEWNGLNKTLEVFIEDEMQGFPIVNDEADVGRTVYKPGIIYIRIHGIDGTRDLKTLKFPIPISAADCDDSDPANTPTESEWNAFITEINAKLAQAVITKEECEAILEQVLAYRDIVSDDKDDVEQLKADTQAIKEQVDAQKEAIDDDIAEAESHLDTYNANYERKLTEFNNNFTAKKKIIDDDVREFEDDYEEKMSALNTAGTAKVNAVNTAGSTQVGNVNTAGNTQVGNVNSAGATQKTAVETAGATQKAAVESAGATQVGNVNTAGSTKVSEVNTAGTAQVSSIETAGTTQTNAVNQAGQQKIDEINSNQTVQQVSEHEIRITRLEKASHIYGIKRARSNNSSSAWERTDDAVGLVANAQIGTTAVRNDFDNIKPWSNIIRKNIDITTGNTTAYYGEAEFKLDGSNGDVYVEYPDIYLKVWQDEDYDYVQIADGPIEGFTKVKSFDLQAYLTGYVDSKLRSYTGIIPARSTTIGTFRTRARALGNNFCLLDWRYFVIQLIYLVEYADYNSQAKLGKGISSMRFSVNDKALIAETGTNRIVINSTGGAEFIVGQMIAIGTTLENFSVATERTVTAINDYDDGTVTGKEIVFDGSAVNIAVNNVVWSCEQISGGCDFLGMKSGCLLDDGKHASSYRGLENVFGNITQLIESINIRNGQVYVCYDPSEYASDKFVSPYEAVGYLNAYNESGAREDYAKTLGFDANNPLIRFPTEVGGASGTYMTDYYYANTGDKVARVGGNLFHGLKAGLWYWRLSSASSTSYWDVGTRVLKYQT